MNTKLDIVIPVGKSDIQIVHKTIYYIYKYIRHDRIFLIINADHFQSFPARFLKKHGIVLIDENGMSDGLTLTRVKKSLSTGYSGWYFQQFLKMAFAMSKFARETYLIWDADTIPLSPLSFFEGSKMLLTAKTENHAPYFDCMQKLIGLGKNFDFSFIAEHMVIKSSIMRELIQEIEGNKSMEGDWIEKILKSITHKQGFSEFETYGTYALVNHKKLFSVRVLNTFRNGTKIYGHNVSFGTLSKLEGTYDTISFEKNQNHEPIVFEKIPRIPNIISGLIHKYLHICLQLFY